MSNADVILAITQQKLTSLSLEIYTAAYPKIFTRTVSYIFEGTNFVLAVDVRAAPVFDLSPSPVARQAVTRTLIEQSGNTH